MSANWSEETYQLGQIPHLCKLPCLVQVSEGIYSSNETETMSAGDIIKIDKHTKIPKVAANFTTSKSNTPCGTVKVFDSEIFVPLNYHGKVKIVNELKNYNSIEELVEDSPRYVELKTPLRVETERKEILFVPTGTTIQLERVIPGLRRGKLKDPDKLVIKFDLKGTDYTVAVPADRPGQFQTLSDEMEYTLKEVVERYKLPKVVEFIQNDLRKVYIESLVDVAENVHTFTDTLRLNRVVVQEVLIGHYKPQDEAEVADESVAHRTLMLLPIDSDIIREIEVNVLEDATDEDYEKLSFVREPVQAVDDVDEMIYVDFAKTKGLVKLENKSDQSRPFTKEEGYCDMKPKLPPRPPKPSQVVANDSDENDYELCENLPKSTKPLGESGDYILMTPKPHKQVAPTCSESVSESDGDYIEPGLNIAGIDFEQDEQTLTMHTPKHDCSLDGALSSNSNIIYDTGMKPCMKGLLPSKKPSFIQRFKGKIYTSNKTLKDSEKIKHSPISPTSKTILKEDNEEGDYDYIDNKFLYKPTQEEVTPNQQKKRVHTVKRKDVAVVKPTAFVSPRSAQSNESGGDEQSFESLSTSQLYERLKKCGMDELAERCLREKLDGPFMSITDINTLKNEPFNLSTFDITKLQRIKENWIPH